MFLENQLGNKNIYQLEITGNGNLLEIKPSVDIYETKDSFIILAEMPDVKKENIKVEIVNGKLYISGKRYAEKFEGEMILRETRDLFYQRFFALDDNLDTNQIRANYAGGILKIEIGKKEKSKPRVIKIN
jgi:HSP20 family protein